MLGLLIVVGGVLWLSELELLALDGGLGLLHLLLPLGLPLDGLFFLVADEGLSHGGSEGRAAGHLLNWAAVDVVLGVVDAGVFSVLTVIFFSLGQGLEVSFSGCGWGRNVDSTTWR